MKIGTRARDLAQPRPVPRSVSVGPRIGAIQDASEQRPVEDGLAAQAAVALQGLRQRQDRGVPIAVGRARALHGLRRPDPDGRGRARGRWPGRRTGPHRAHARASVADRRPTAFARTPPCGSARSRRTDRDARAPPRAGPGGAPHVAPSRPAARRARPRAGRHRGSRGRTTDAAAGWGPGCTAASPAPPHPGHARIRPAATVLPRSERSRAADSRAWRRCRSSPPMPCRAVTPARAAPARRAADSRRAATPRVHRARRRSQRAAARSQCLQAVLTALPIAPSESSARSNQARSALTTSWKRARAAAGSSGSSSRSTCSSQVSSVRPNAPASR